MNLNKSIHPIVTVVFTLIGGLYVGLLSVIFWIARELTQAEYRWIERYGNKLRKNMPWYAPLDYRVWDTHSFFWNMVLPFLLYILLMVLWSININ